MARALDRVKAAEAKYEAMAETAEKLESTLKELKSTAKSCQWSIDELRRVADREREDENTDFWMFVLMAGIMGVVGGLLGNFFREVIVRIMGALGAWWEVDGSVPTAALTKRYKIVTEEKAGGATYTPKNLADFVARQIIQTARHFPTDRPLEFSTRPSAAESYSSVYLSTCSMRTGWMSKSMALKLTRRPSTSPRRVSIRSSLLSRSISSLTTS